MGYVYVDAVTIWNCGHCNSAEVYDEFMIRDKTVIPLQNRDLRRSDVWGD